MSFYNHVPVDCTRLDELEVTSINRFIGESNLQIDKTCPSGATTSTLRHIEQVDVIETAQHVSAENRNSPFYRPPKKMRECNIFSYVCPSFCSWGTRCDYYSWCIGPHPYPLTMVPYYTGPPCHWYLVPILGDLFTWGPTNPTVPTSRGYWSMYSWQAGGTNTTGMLSFSLF